jgi:hypothetical protein
VSILRGRELIKTRTALVVGVLVLLVALYAAAGFWLAPRLVRSALLEDIPKALGPVPTVGEIRINPFLLQVTVKDFSLADQEGRKLLGFERLFIDFQLSSLWRRAYSFANIDIAAPYLNASVAKDGTLNLAKLHPVSAAPPKPPETKNEPLPSLRVGSFKVTQGAVSYEDRSRPSEFTANLQPINFELRDFTTGVAGGLFTFTGSSNLGERIEWHGHLSVQPIESDGELRIDSLRAHTIWEYLEDQLNFVINSGQIDLDATYKFSLKDTVDLQLNLAKLAAADITLRPRDSELDLVTIPGLTVLGTTVDLAPRRVHIDSLSLTGVKISTWLEPDGSFNLLKLMAARVASAKAQAASSAGPGATSPALAAHPASPPVAASSSAAASPPWQVELHEFNLTEAHISAEDRTTRPTPKIVLAPLSLHVTGASLDLAKPVHVALETRINESGSLTANGEVTPQPAAASWNLKIADIDLTALQPYIGQHTSMTLRSGRLGGDAKFRYGANQKPVLLFAGNIHVDGLHTVDDTLHDDFVNWQRLDILGLNYQQSPDRLEIAQIVARKPYARVIVETDSSLNVKRVLTGPGPAPPPQPPPTDQGSTAKTVAKQRSSHGSPPAQSASAGPAPGSSQPMPMAIKKVAIEGGLANFTDLSVAPNFSAGIQNLGGTVLGLSSKPSSRAKVDLHGNIDAFSPVSITGEVNLLGAALYTDLAMSFRNIELSIFNPYSGKFAGYNIAKGKLTTELHYKVDSRKLDAQHHIIIDQLEFGDKTASKDAVSLPVKLAVALLKDRNGVIDLNLPITGSLDDPKFRLAPIIWKVLVNILEKAVTEPFALLGALFGGGPDIQFVEFHPGTSSLDPAAVDKVKTVAKALAERPQLKIEVPIAIVPEVDRPALAAAQFNAQLNELQTLKVGRKKSGGAAPPPYDQLDPGAKLELLTELYVKDVGAEPKYPAAVTDLKQKPELASAKIDFLTQGIREHLVVGDADLNTLGQQRAMVLEQALLSDSQIDPARVFLVANDKASSKDGLVRLELSLR